MISPGQQYPHHADLWPIPDRDRATFTSAPLLEGTRYSTGPGQPTLTGFRIGAPGLQPGLQHGPTPSQAKPTEYRERDRGARRNIQIVTEV